MFQRAIFYFLYYGFARFLPPSFMPGGGLAKNLRYLVCSKLFASCGSNVNIEQGAYFNSGKDVFIGQSSGIGINAFISGKVTIGQNVMMGKDVIITTVNHQFDRTDIPMNQQGFKEQKPVVIGDDVWISDRVVILPGIRVGNGSIIGAGAIVTKDVPEFAIVAGNPAKVIRLRK